MTSNIIYSTFISGFSELIKEIIKKEISGSEIMHLLDGAVIYKTTASLEFVKELQFFNNSFYVLSTIEPQGRRLSFESVISVILKGGVVSDAVKIKFSTNDFKLFFYENQFISIERESKSKLEKLIQKSFRLNNSKSSQNFVEFWLLKRSENIYFFLLRLTEEKAKLSKGELRTELAWILAFLSEPTCDDIFLDPFAGKGAIPLARIKQPYSKIFISDIDRSSILHINNKLQRIKKKSNVHISNQDFLATDYGDVKFNKIITDPPWGSYSNIENIPAFYQEMFKRFSSCLFKKGILVILVERHIQIEGVLINFQGDLECTDKYEILLSGRKASIYKIQK